MSLRVIGAGLGRTGTLSLKLALERLLGCPCYHMVDVFSHLDHIPVWEAATAGTLPDWSELFDGFSAAVDEPPAAWWRELSEAYPEALVVLSLRDPESWWESADETAFAALRGDPPPGPPFLADWQRMTRDLFDTRFPGMLHDHEKAIAAFDRHNAEVRETIPGDRLLEWWPAEGWAPLCAALDVPVPDEPFPRANTRAEWRARMGNGS